jgi:hypothetical protein
MQHAYGRRRIHIGFWPEIQTEGDHLEDLDIGGRIILKGIVDR